MMKRSLRIASFALLVSLVALLLWAVAYSPGVDADLFNNEPSCRAPCWHQLTLGQSTTSDVVHFVDGLSRFQLPERNVHKYGTQIDWIRIIHRTRIRYVDIEMEGGKLTFIRSSGFTTATLGQVVEHFGPPEYVRAGLAVGPERSIYQLEVYYPKRGLSFEISTKQTGVGQIDASMPVVAIQYFQPGDFRDIQGISLAPEEVEKYLRPWPGFGKVELTVVP